MSTVDLYPRLVESLAEVRRTWRERRLAEGSLRAIALVALALLLAIVVDNVFPLDRGGRVASALTIGAVALISALHWVVRRALEDRSDDYFAALVEEGHPELRNSLINALQLGRGTELGVSRPMVEAVVRDAVSATKDRPLADELDRRRVRQASVAALCALVLLAGYGSIRTQFFMNALTRILLPLAHIAPYTETRISDRDIKPRHARVPEGTTVAVEAKVAGKVPASARLLRRAPDGAWHPSPMSKPPGATDIFRATVLQPGDSFDYTVEAGDARSSVFHVEVVKRPRVASIALVLVPPAYTGQPIRRVTSKDGEIAAPAGTSVGYTLEATKPLAQAWFLTDRGDRIDLARGGDNRTWGTSFVLRHDNGRPGLSAPARYQVKLRDEDGFDDADPLWRSLDLLMDQPPTVTITAPGRDVQVPLESTLAIAVETEDDYGVAETRLLSCVNEGSEVSEVARFDHRQEGPRHRTRDRFAWKLSTGGLKPGDRVVYWATAEDRNNVTGPGRAESRRFSVFITAPEASLARLEIRIADYAQALEELVRLQRENRAQTAGNGRAGPLVERQLRIRKGTRELAWAMEKDALPVATIVVALDDLHGGLMAEALHLLETDHRTESLPVQDKIIVELEALLTRLQRNEQAKKELRKIAKNDQPAHKALTGALGQLIKDLDRLLKDETELASKFERLPKKPVDELTGETMKPTKDLEEFQKKWNAWAKGTVNELTKLPTGFIDDFQLRPDVNRIFEEIEKVAQRPKSEKIEVALEDLGAGLATKMKEDLEMWMPDAPDAAKWILEEPLANKPMAIPEMALPNALEDMIGELLQKADEFDEEADDITSAWGDNLDQAGWGVSDGPISTFSAKGKTGNDLPNSHEVSGRAGDGRRGKSSGQMVGDTARALQGRKTPARVGNERYEPGQLKQEGQDDPNGATGGGKKAGGGRRGLQGGTPPDFVRDMGRLSAKQAGLREQAEQVARKLETAGIASKRLNESIEQMRSVETDLRDLRYQDAARKRRVALNALRGVKPELDQATAAQVSRARDLPPQLRTELLQAADEGYPPGYETLLKAYYKALSTAEK
jgi:hypothetical protein